MMSLPQAYHEIFPSSLGIKGTGPPGFSELWTVMNAIENAWMTRARIKTGL